MKKTFLPVFAVLAILAACSKADIEPTEETGNTPVEIRPDGDRILCSIPDTKTSLDGSLNVIWSESDEIMVLGEENRASKYVFSSFVDGTDNKTAVFENSGPKVTGRRSAIYPASAYVEDSYNGTSAKISLGGVTTLPMPVGTASTNFLSSSTKVSDLPLVSIPSEGNLSFSNLFGGIMFHPYDYMGTGVKIKKLSVKSVDGEALAGIATIDTENGKITAYEGSTTELTYTATSDTDITSKKGFVAYLPAGEYTGLVITAIDHLSRKFSITTGAVSISSGKIKTLPQLSLTVWYGSANCIRVAPGTTSVSIDVTPRYTFKSDYDISSGKPVRVENGNLSHYGKDAKVVWQQKENSTSTDLTASTSDGTIVSGDPSISFNDNLGTATMTVPLTGEKGNAVVSICYGTTVAWSFHIWVSDIAETAIGSKTFLDRNLGAVSTTPGDRDAYGLCYQWGRKDPFPRFLTDADDDVVGYKSRGDLLKTVNKSTGGTIAYTVKNPDTRITSNKGITCQTGYFWLKSKNTALWGCGKSYGSSTDAKNGTSIKTVYDPCPQGYKVPTYGDLLSYSSVTLGSATKGRTVGGNYFPFGGFIRLEESFLSSGKTGWMTDTRGYLWSSICRTGSNEQGAYILKYNKDNFNINNGSATDINGTGRGDQIFGFHCDALPVRCIKE